MSWVTDGEKGEQREAQAWVGACENGRKEGCLQLAGNLFLPFSLNKGCDWFHCVRTYLVHVGNKALKRLIHSEVTTTTWCHRVVNEPDRQEKPVFTFCHMHAARQIHSFQIPLFYAILTWKQRWPGPDEKRKWCWNGRVLVFPKQIHTEKMGRIFYPPSYKNVNKPAFKYNDLQHTHRGERNCKPVLINVALRLSERVTSLNLP